MLSTREDCEGIHAVELKRNKKLKKKEKEKTELRKYSTT